VSRRLLTTALVAVAALLAWFVGGAGENPTVSASAASPAVSVFPTPGARAAMPQSQITFRGIPASAIGTVTVTGSKSGVHSGHIAPDSDGNGGSFLLDHPFKAGEKVTVSTNLNILNANGGSSSTSGGSTAGGGTPGGTFTFTVAQPTGPLPTLHWPPQGRTRKDVQFFHSRHDLSPVSITVTKHGATGDGDFFIAPQWGPVQDGPMILDPNGNLIWFDARSGDTSASDFRVQTYQGKPVLTWWQGTMAAGVGIGQDVIFDNTYKEVATVSAANGLRADLHAFQLTKQGTAFITANYPIYYNSTSVKGGNKRQIVMDSAVQEIDVKTGLVLFEWDAIDHVPLTDSYATPPKSLGSPFDPYHLNSVDVDSDGNIIVSSRNTWAAYKININSGAVMWTLGGKHSSFKLGSGASFAFQHDVRSRASGDSMVTLFDDEGGPPTLHNARALTLALDFKHMTANKLGAISHSPGLWTNYEGNVQQISSTSKVVGWGMRPYFSEYSNGHTVFDAYMAGSDSTFAAYRFQWTAVPWTLPAIAASTSGKTTTVFASWNGATTVASWRVLSGSSPTTLTPGATVRKSGFESKLTVPAAKYVAVQALSSSGQVIKASTAVAPKH
jgi:hypothetical protein